jgi:hypothetical protein
MPTAKEIEWANRGFMEDKRRTATVYVVEATHNEQHGLWREYSQEAARGGWGTPKNKRVPWKAHSDGWIPIAGVFAKHVVSISIFWTEIHGQLVMFWEPTSRIVDHELCEKWLEENVPCYKDNHTNLSNFHHCLMALEKN